jgi:hypothetical protein
MADAPLPFVEGSGEGRLGFEEIDQGYQLKIHPLIRLCMTPVFTDLERQVDLRSLRLEGTIPIMFYLEFGVHPQPLAFFGRVRTQHRVHLRRSVIAGPPGASAGRVERLLLDMRIEVSAEESSGDRASLGAERRSGSYAPAGWMRGVHVLTRPVAPPGQRHLLNVPEQLRGLQEHPWEGPYPSIELLSEVPPAFREGEAGPWQEQRSVWALHNTDINQHVNVQEYLTGLENHFSRILFGANLPVARHRIAQMRVLFRKPFFAGEAHAFRGRLFTDDHRTLLLGGVHRLEPEGGLDPLPSVFARMEGEISPAG